MSEKIGGAKGTELDEEFVEMERVSCFTGLSAYILTYTMLYYLFTTKVLKIWYNWLEANSCEINTSVF